MKTFEILSIEHYTRLHDVQAETLEEALDKIGEDYENGEIDLVGDEIHYNGMDFIEVENFLEHYLDCECRLKPKKNNE